MPEQPKELDAETQQLLDGMKLDTGADYEIKVCLEDEGKFVTLQLMDKS